MDIEEGITSIAYDIPYLQEELSRLIDILNELYIDPEAIEWNHMITDFKTKLQNIVNTLVVPKMLSDAATEIDQQLYELECKADAISY